MPTITNQGALPIPPTELLAEEIAQATLLAPGLTADLPGSIVEDMASTATGALVIIDQAATDLINSISPSTANGALLYQLGYVYGVRQGIGSNTSVYVTFNSDTPGFTISPGFIVSDGANQFAVQEGGVIPTSGQTEPIFCIAISPGTFSVAIGTVTQIITSLPSTITLSCVNLTAGVPGQAEQSIEEYRAQVIQAGQATAQGTPQFLKTQLNKVVGVQNNLVSVRPSGTKWEIIVGGGDPYEVANAILQSVPDIANLVGSTLTAATITNAYPAVVTSNINHIFTTGQTVTFSGATGMSGLNGVNFIALVTDQKTFSLNVIISTITWLAGIVTVTTASPHNLPAGTSSGNIYGVTPIAYNGAFTFTRTGANTFTYPLASNPGLSTVVGYTGFNSTLSGAYAADSATILPNLRNVTVSISDYPDVYEITFVNPPQQQVVIDLTWNTISTNFVSATTVATLGAVAIADYVNGIGVGQPINIFEMQIAFQNSLVSVLQPDLISKMLFTVVINGVVTPPDVDTGVVYGDPESYFKTNSTSVIIAQG
jgi:hypothetical protein